MSVRKFPEPESMRRGIVGTCKWCGKDTVKKPARYWHPECVIAYKAHKDPDVQYSLLCERDGEKCHQCGDHGQYWRHLGEYTSHDWGNLAPPFDWPGERKGSDFFAARREHERPHLVRYTAVAYVRVLEIDHRVPLWKIAHLPDDERRPYFGPRNIWLLCAPCHKAKTKREAAERAATRRK